ncbi:hypothetical protein V6O07_09510, partial [Arthrospira platensis SPKY2]
HDRRFLERVATRVWEVQDGRFLAYEGDWAFYRRKRLERRTGANGAAPLAPGARDAAPRERTSADRSALAADDDGDRRSAWQLRQDLGRWEAEIEQLEAALAEVRA